jgi:hypothetical protein
MKGISILGWKETESSYSIDLVTLAWDQRLLQWEVNLKMEQKMKDKDEEREEAKSFRVGRSLLSSLQSQSAYQNQFEYYYRSASLFQSDESLSLTNSKNTVNQQNISIQFKNGIVVYISEIASLFTLETTKPDKEESSQERNWICAVVGEGFQILQIKKQ